MKSIYDLCVPRPEVLKGELREDIFAARLKNVLDGDAIEIYGNPEKFFENTYPTAGLKTLLTEALGRLTGDSAGKNSIIRLETAFGGGKTHNLIALYHVLSGNTPQEISKDLLGRKINFPKPDEICIAGVVGSELDPTVGIDHPEDKIKTFTLWGELAYNLGGVEGYKLVEESDVNTKAAPGIPLWESLIGEKPTLIMIDEIGLYLRIASAIPTATGGKSLADMTAAFLMPLIEFAASKERCLVVLTLADETSAFAPETAKIQQVLSESLSVSARQEKVLTPTDEDEISSIVTHRLFKSIDRKGAKAVFDSYVNYYGQMLEKNAELPQRCSRAEYKKEIMDAYPFHPELLTTLNRKTSTIPNFNQTRGALRLLAWTVRALWENKETKPWTIHLHHINLTEEQIVEDLTSKLDRPKFKQVVQADIVSVMKGMPAHAQTVDEPLLTSGKPPYGQRLATSIFIHSLTQGVASGVDPSDLMLAVLEPGDGGSGDDPAVVKRQLEKLYDQAWFLEYDGHRYRFKTEPSINKIISDEAGHVPVTRAKSEIERRIKQIWKRGFFKPVPFPAEPMEVDDDAELPKLVIIHFDAANVAAKLTKPPELVQKIYQYSGSMESFRNYQNNVIFLVADSDQVDNMVNVARRYLAIERIVGDPSRLGEFNDEQKKELKKTKDAAELDFRIAITKTYKHLYYPSPDAPKSHNYLRRESLPPQDQGDIDKDQSNVILRVMRSLKKVIAADEELQSAAWLKSKAWDRNQVSMSTEDLRKSFARKIGLKMLLDIGQLRKTIENGVKTGVWIYYDTREEFGYDRDVPPPAWEIGDQTILYLPEESERLNIRIKGKWTPPLDGETPTPPSGLDTCPVCGNPQDQCTCGADVDIGKPHKVGGEGAVAQAFQQVLDQCQEYKIISLTKVFIRIDGTGKQGAMSSRALGLAIPQFGKGQFYINQKVHAVFNLDKEKETFVQEFQGTWGRYKRLKNVVDAFGDEADELKVEMRVQADFEKGIEVNGDQFLSMRDVLTTLDVGRIVLEGVPDIENE